MTLSQLLAAIQAELDHQRLYRTGYSASDVLTYTVVLEAQDDRTSVGTVYVSHDTRTVFLSD